MLRDMPPLRRRTNRTPAAAAERVRTRELTDARSMRALAHPTRVELMELIAREGPVTATQAGAHLDLSPANASFHLRTLARYGFVEEAPGGRGRERPWRLVSTGHSWSEAADVPAELTAAGQQLQRVVVDRAVGQLHEYLRHQQEFPREWRDAALTNDWQVFLTADELRAVAESVSAALRPYLERLTDPTTRPDDALAVKFLSFGVPLELPVGDAHA
jgi:DNA-binding transcriptional ArsR family regulator